MNLEEYDYTLPAELIAQEPAAARDQSKLMVLPFGTDTVYHRKFFNLPEFIQKGDLLVVNDTEVFPARLIGRKEPDGGKVELFLLKPYDNETWDALSRPARRLHTGSILVFGDGLLRSKIVEKGIHGHVRVQLESELPIDMVIDRIGKTPLPPYIKREPVESDRERYQTVYAKYRGSVAAPTAGLHFTQAMLDLLISRGVVVASVTLHVGIGTFRPLRTKEAQGNRLHSEYCRVPYETAQTVKECRMRGGRVIAVGTTTARALESAAINGEIMPFDGWTDIFIKPPYTFRAVNVLLTNFHLPRSSLLLLVCAFAGRERILNAYREAVRHHYRFYSYGDTMLIVRSER